MTPEEIEALIDHKIALHERRIGWISGIAGAIFMVVLFVVK